MALTRSGIGKGIKHSTVAGWERGAHRGDAVAMRNLSLLSGEVSSRSRLAGRFGGKSSARGAALTWANVSRLPPKEIATQISMAYLKASVKWKWPRKVTYADFEQKVVKPLIESGARGYDGRPINSIWISGTVSPKSILKQAELEVNLAAQRNEKISVRDALEGFWARDTRSGWRGLTRAQGLSALRFSNKPKKPFVKK